MPTATYDLIASNVLTSSASSITFSSIPSTYRDLVVIVQGTSGSITTITLTANSETSYPFVDFYGWGASRGSRSGTRSQIYGAFISGLANGFSIFQIQDYSATDRNKGVLVRNNQPLQNSPYVSEVITQAARIATNSAITTITVGLTGGSYNSGASFYLYGIAS